MIWWINGFVFQLVFCSFGFATEIDPNSTVELHAHLFMKEGLTWLFEGDFDHEIKASDSGDRLRSQANAKTLDLSGNAIVVISLYAHPLLTWSPRDSIRRQIEQTHRFVSKHPDWAIAKSPHEAQSYLASGKRVLLFSLEGASGILDTEADLVEFVDQLGIRIVTLLHLTDDSLGGVAFLKGLPILSSPLAWIRHFFWPAYDAESKIWINDQGLTDQGTQLVKKLIARKVWIDLAHSSDRAQNQLRPLLLAAHQPLLYTHTVLRKYLKAERGISQSQLQAVADSGGILGLMPSTQLLQGTPGNTGMDQLTAQYLEISQTLPAKSIFLGSDTNGGIPHLDEYWNIGQAPTLWGALKERGAKIPEPRRQMVNHFIEAWLRVFARQ